MLSKRWARLSIALSPLLLSACGSDRGHDPSEDGDDGGTSGSRATGGASGTGSATGGTAGTDVPSVCRLYGSRYVTESDGIETFYSCAFDRPSLTLSCSDDGSDYSTSDTWARIEDAVQENRPLGKLRMVRSTVTDLYPSLPMCDFVYAYAYDSLGRLTSIVSIPASETCITWDFYFDSWDAEGRPTLGLAFQDSDTCPERDVTLGYDDTSRILTFTSSGVGAGCQDASSQSTYDENGLLQSFADDSGRVIRHTTLETGEICRGGG